MKKDTTTQENPARQLPLWVLLETLKKPLKAQWRLAALTILCGWGKFVLPMGVPLITGHLIDDVLLQPADADTKREILQLGGLSLVLLFFLGVSAYHRSSSHWTDSVCSP